MAVGDDCDSKDCRISPVFAWTLQKDLKVGIYCFNIHLSYIALPKLHELLKMQIRIMVIEWLWLTWKRFDHQYNGA